MSLTARKLAELIASLGDSLPEGLFTTDLQGRITWWNREAERITGWTREQATGQTCQLLAGDAVHGCQREGGPLECKLAARGRSSKTCTLRTRDGRLLRVVKNAVPITDDDGAPVGAFESFTSVGELGGDEPVPLSRHAPAGAFGMIGRNACMQELFRTIGLIAQSEATVMILGESGTGKERVASAIHRQSRRASGPFVRVACSALNENLLESELFGHVRGAFTGAVKDRRGRFEEASGGTLLLDEIGDLSPAVQVKLLRAIEEREVERVGDSRPIKVDVRLLCATHRDLRALVKDGSFRADLYFRLAVFPLHVPSLKERGDDLDLLAETFLAAQPNGGAAHRLTAPALARLRAYDWPGNVRELQNVLEYASLRAAPGAIAVEHLPAQLQTTMSAPPQPSRVPPAELSEARLREVLERCGWNRAEAARQLQISRVTLWKRLKALGLGPSEEPVDEEPPASDARDATPRAEEG